MLWWRKKRKNQEIAPDEIFLDASNSPAFDRYHFEGRLENPITQSTFFYIGLVIAAILLILLLRTGYLQIIQGEAFAADSARNSLNVITLFAPRGVIVDRHGELLAENIVTNNGDMRRRYSLPELGQIIGYVSFPKKDDKGIYYQLTDVGKAGLEASYNEWLTGTNGHLLTEIDALGVVRSQGVIKKAKEGKTLALSIDTELQRHFTTAIRNAVSKKGFIAGAGVIMDVHTGAVHAIVSYPSYDPNIMSYGGPVEVIDAYHNNPGSPFLDHATQGVFAPGSIVKPFIAAGALTDNFITPQTVINDPGFISIPDPYRPGREFIFRSWRELGLLDVRDALAWSSNVFFYAVGGGYKSQKGLGIKRLNYWYSQFGLGSETGIDLPGESQGLLATPEWKQRTFGEPWYLGDTYFTAIGQYSMQVTPIQMARATSAIANGGRLHTPTLRLNKPPYFITLPVDAGALSVVREGMRKSVTSALASSINVPYVSVAAKTGTVQTGARNQFTNSWIIGFFPYENPKYAFAVVLERGRVGLGSQAANVMRDLFYSLNSVNSSYVNSSKKSTILR